jgi:hypothetical protein
MLLAVATVITLRPRRSVEPVHGSDAVPEKVAT